MINPLAKTDIFKSDCPYEWKCHRYAPDDPLRMCRHGMMTVREYRAHNRPSLFKIEIQPWLSTRQDWCFQTGLNEQPIGPFATSTSCEVALRVAFGREILP